MTTPSSTTTKPPLISLRRLAARAISSSFDADDADIVAVVADRRGDGAFLQAKTLDETIGVVAVFAVALDDRDLDHVIAEIDVGLVASGRQAVATMLGDDLAGHDTDDRAFRLLTPVRRSGPH